MNLKNKHISRLKGYIKSFIGLPLTLISFFFIAKLLFDNWKTISTAFVDFNPVLAVIGTFFIAIFFGVKSYIWQLLLKSEGYNVPIRQGLFLYASAEIKRYTPGNIFSFLARIVNFERLNVPKSVSLKLIVSETILIVAGSAIASLPAIPLISTLLTPYIQPNALYTLSIVIGLGGVIAGIILHRMKKFVFPSNFFELLFVSVVGWTFFGIGNYMIARSFTSLDLSNFVEFSAFFVFSWLLGFLSFITPSGLGVREAVITLGLSPFLPLSLAGTLAVLLRVCIVVGEMILLAGLSIVYSLKHSNNVLVFLRKIGLATSVLIVLVTAYIAYFSYFTFEKHSLFLTGRYDLGNMEQTVWNTLYGRFFVFTHPDVNAVTSRLAVHADFILVLLTPFYALWQDARMLLFIQTVIIAFGAFFVYKIARVLLKNDILALVLSFSYLLNPYVQEQNLFDFHAVSLVTTFLLASFYYFLKGNNRAFIGALFLAVLTKEHIWAVAGLFGIYVFFKKSRLWGATLAAFSFIMFYLLIAQFIPDARSGDHFALGFYDELGESPKDIILSIILSPQNALQLIFKNNILEYLTYVLLPTGFLGIFAPLFLLFAGPEFAVNLLSKNPNLRSYHYHYAAAIVPFIYISTIYGIRQIHHITHNRINQKVFVLYILITSLFSAWYFGPLPGSRNPDLAAFTYVLANKQAIHDYLDSIPQDLSVGATNNVAAHLIKRRNLYTLPYAVGKAELLVFLVKDIDKSTSPDAVIARSLYANEEYREVYKVNDFVVFRKIQ